MTYSINNGLDTESIKKENINEVINQLPDNSSQLIEPEDVRNAVYTLYENITYKPTQLGNYVYIGIGDYTGTEPNPDYMKYPTLFGKKKVNASYVMNSTRLDSDGDYYFYNNKPDNVSDQNTKVVFLAGNSSVINNKEAYIEYRHDTFGTQSYHTMNVVNEDSINIKSEDGFVSLNNIKFPKIGWTADNGDVLKYNNGELYFDAAGNTDTLSSSGTVSITGSPVLVNNYPLEFSDTNEVPVTIGGIQAGESFPDPTPLVEMVRRLLYPYLPPTASVTAQPSVAEVNINSTSINLQYSVTKISATASITGGMPNSNLPSITNTTSGVATGTILNAAVNGSQTWVLIVNDTAGSTVTANTTHTRVYPFFYGVSATATDNSVTFINTVLPNLTKLVKTQSNTNAMLGGQNVCIYFAYPNSYPALNNIKDNNGFDVTSSFVIKTMTLSSAFPTVGYWSNITYRVYIYAAGGTLPATTTVGSINQPIEFKFNF